MTHSNREIEFALRTAIKETIDSGKEEALTVRYIRDKVVESLSLDEGFFVTEAWKSKSKQFIQATAAELLDAKEQQQTTGTEITPKSVKKQAVPTQKAPKHAAQTDRSRPTKRRKKEATPPSEEEPSELSEKEDTETEEELSELSDEEEESLVSEFDDSDISDAPKSKKKAKPKSKPKTKAPVKRQTKNKAKDQSDESEDDMSEIVSDVEDSEAASPPKKAKIANDIPNKRKSKEMVVDSDEESSEAEAPNIKAPKSKRKSRNTVVESNEESEDEKPAEKSISAEKLKSQSLPRREQFTSVVPDDDEDTKANDSESDMSIVLDEPPKPKKRGLKFKSSPSSTSTKTTKSKPAKVAKELSPNEALIKTLQSQLVKCGVRKIWAFELKQYGEDSKGKIRHLQGMLRDIGMAGRFSEGRAKEIKELRELQADLEAVKEGEKSWGLAGGRRVRGGQRKSLKESSVEEDEGDEDGYGGEQGRSRSTSEKPSKAARAKQELAFLGDEDESDSD